MKKIFLLILIIAGLQHNLQAQDNPQAVKLLKSVTDKLNGYKNIYAEFKYTLNNKKAGVKQETKGKVTIQGNKFYANYMGIDDIYDGQKRYQIIHENEEINISTHRDEDEFTPHKIFTFYQKGYTKKMDIKQNNKGRLIQYVKLIPRNSNSPEKYILLGINLKTKNINNAIIVEKNGSMINLDITKFQTNQVLPQKLFQFDKNKYPDYYVNELD
jgi:outer membrane lipoprotein-sorting protein